MVRVWVAGKTVRSPCYTRAISEHFRDDIVLSGFLIYFGIEIQGLFKDFQGP